MEKHYNVLSENQVEMEKINNTNYKGKINIKSESEWVMFTIPYEKGWKIKVNGKEVEYEEVLDTLIAINLSEGENEITFTFVPYGIYIGACLSVFGVILLIVIYKKSVDLLE